MYICRPGPGKITAKGWKGQVILKIYYVCEWCQQIFNCSEVEGPDGAVELKGTCEECAREIGLDESVASVNSLHYYN
jgi:hypothetical protein